MQDQQWRIGCLGPEGTFSEQAARNYAAAQAHKVQDVRRFHTIEEVVLATEAGEIEEGVVPFENSIEGMVNATMDSLIFDTNLFIKAQIILPISENMFVKKINSGKIDVILSHPQALAQSRKFIRTHYPEATEVPVSSTSEAARMVAEGLENAAAIGNALAADIYGLHTLHRDIQEDKSNATTFIVVTKQDTSEPKKGCKTSLAFSTRNEPGELYKLLDIFAIWDLNMTKIQSRPMKGKPGEYVFLIDLEGYEQIADVKDALQMVSRKTSYFKILGSYPTM